MPRDYAAQQTDKELAKLERKLSLLYSDSKADLDVLVDNYYNGWTEDVWDSKKMEYVPVHHAGMYERYKQEYQAFLDGKYHDPSGQYTDEEVFNRWVWSQEGRGKHIEAMRDAMAKNMTQTNQRAAAMINDKTPGIYSLNANWEAYKIEVVHKTASGRKSTKKNGKTIKGNKIDVAFNLVREQTIKELAMDKNHVEFRVNRVNPKRDYAWNKEQITNALASGILQGESPYKIAERYLVVMQRNKAAAIRNARTSITSAQNAGCQNTYDRAVEMGIKLQKQWMSTRDDRTRDSHILANGQHVDVYKEFTVGGSKMMYPGDVSAPPSEVYNCRCTMVTLDPAVLAMNSDPYDVKGFEEWVKEKEEREGRKILPDKVAPEATEEAKKDDKVKEQIERIMNSAATVKGLNDAQKTEFRKFIENMDPDYRDIYEKMTQFHKRNQYDRKGTGWYAPYNKAIEMDINALGWEKTCGRNSTGSFKTKFHEELHQLDHIFGNTTGNLRSDTATKISETFYDDDGIFGKRLAGAIQNDILNFINAGIDKRNASGGKKIKQLTSLDRMTATQKDAFWDHLDDVVTGKNYAETNKNKALISPFTDAVGLCTKAKLNAYNNGYWGHTASYQKDRGVSGATSECFAEIGAFLFMGDEEALDACRKVMPESVKEYESVFREIAEYVRSNEIDYR